MTKERISPSERQLNLTFALLQSAYGLTKREVLASVPGYGYNSNPSESDFTMFDRDKDDIRKAGVVLDQVPLLGEEDDNREYRYRIANKTFSWPDGFHPSPLQSRLLELAAHCWQDLSLTDELRMAMTRIVALGETPDRQAIAELVPSFRPLDASFAPISAAIENSESIEFSYRKPNSDQVERRSISPWRFLNVEGQWLIQGWCFLRQAPRNFLLQRIVDKRVKVLGDVEFVPATSQLLAQAEADLAQFRSANLATIRVVPDSPAWSAFEMEFESSDVKELRFLDAELLANQLRRFGNQVEILQPQSLAEAVRAGLLKVVAAHA